MPPNLRSVVVQGWRSIGSRRNFSSSPRSGESKRACESRRVLFVNLLSGELDLLKAAVVPSFKTFHIGPWMTSGFLIYTAIEIYKYNKVEQKLEDLNVDILRSLTNTKDS